VPHALHALAEAYGDKRTATAAYVSGAYTLQAIAVYFGIPSSTVRWAGRSAEGQKTAEHTCMIARPAPAFLFVINNFLT